MIKIQVSAEVFKTLFEEGQIIKEALVLSGLPKNCTLLDTSWTCNDDGEGIVEFTYDDGRGDTDRVEHMIVTWQTAATPKVTNEDYEATFERLWKDIIMNTDGSVNLDQVKRELHDFAFMMGEVSHVYSHVTGGILSKPNYYASSVIGVHDDYVEKQCQDVIENRASK